MFLQIHSNLENALYNDSAMQLTYIKKKEQNKIKMKALKVWFSLVWFYGISTIVGYLMPNPFLYI